MPGDRGKPQHRPRPDDEQLADRRERARKELGRKRGRSTPEEQGVFDDGAPPLFHDMLIIGPPEAQADDELFRVPVVKVPDRAKKDVPGDYVDLPEKLDPYDYSNRRTLSTARPQDWGRLEAKRPRGPAFGTLPVKREPAATNCFACYLLDAQNFSFRNAWTAEEWNDVGAQDLPPHPSADDPVMEVMLAGPRGKVFHLKLVLEEKGEDVWPTKREVALPAGGFIESLELRHEMEIWNQLRNGTVAGRVLSYRKAIRDNKPPEEVDYVPLVNITSLVPDEPVVEAQNAAAARRHVAAGGNKK